MERSQVLFRDCGHPKEKKTQFILIWHYQYHYSLAAIVKLLLCMNRAKWKLAGFIPISQHALICFQSNLHSEFSVFLKLAYWIAMVSLLFLVSKALQGSSSPASTTSHLHHLKAFSWLLMLTTMCAGETTKLAYPCPSCPPHSSNSPEDDVLQTLPWCFPQQALSPITEERAAYQEEHSRLLQYFLLLPHLPSPSLSPVL